MSVSAIVLRNHVEIKNIDEEEEEQEETQRQNFGLSRIALSGRFSFRECFFRRSLQPVNCAIVSCVELL